MGSGSKNESNSHQLARIDEKKIFYELDVHHVYKLGITCFSAQDAKMTNSHQLARIGEKKIFHELDVHHVYKVGITCFWAQDAKMSLTATRSLESATTKFLINMTYIMSTK